LKVHKQLSNSLISHKFDIHFNAVSTYQAVSFVFTLEVNFWFVYP